MTVSSIGPTDAPDGEPELITLATLPNALKAHFENLPGSTPANQILKHTTRAYLNCLDRREPPSPAQVETQLLALVNAEFANENARHRSSRDKIPSLKTLTAWQIAQCLLQLHHIVRIAPTDSDTDEEYDLLGMYCDNGDNAGVYTTSDDKMRAAAREYDTGLSINGFAEIRSILREASRRTHVCQNRDLIAVENGIVNYSTKPLDVTVDGQAFHFEPKSLHPFDPAFVFLTKSHVKLDPNAQSPVITHPVDQSTWEVEEWMTSLSDDPEIVNLLWEILGAIIRPHVRWNKSAWFFSEQGNNGKGTLCELMRNLTGPGAYTSIPLSEFSKEFALEPLMRASAIIVDENDVGTFVDKAANLKTIVTNDVLQVNRKYRMPVAFQFWGFMVQCLNEFPRVKDKSDSFYRRQLFVPFEKCFTGAERKYIKDDYLRRKDVLEYVLKRVLLDMDYYALSEPPATRAVLAEYQEFNDPVRAWWNEFRGRFAWDLVPFTFAYECYRPWFVETSPSGSPIGRATFIADLISIVRSDPDWFCPGKTKQIRPASMMNAPEPLIAEYDLKKWMDPHYRGNDPLKKSRPLLAGAYRGIQRTRPGTTVGPLTVTGDDETEGDQ